MQRDLGYKLLALGIAFVLWFYVNSERNPHSRKPFTVPIKTVNHAKGYLYDLSAGEVVVTVEGLKSVVDSVRKDDIVAYVNLGLLQVGRRRVTRTLPINVKVANLLDGLRVTSTPRKIKVTAETLTWRRLPVEVKFLSAPPLGYAYEPNIQPGSIEVSGKGAAVARVRKVVLPLSCEGHSREVDGQFEVIPLDASGGVVSGVKLEPDTVRISLRLVEVPATKTVIVSPTVEGVPKYPARVVSVSVKPASVTLEGKPSMLMGVSTISTDRVSVDQVTGSVTQEVFLRVPRGVRVVGRSRARVTVNVTTQD